MGAHHAIVIGGSLGGLCAARILSVLFGRVTIVERDALPRDVADRPGVPQARHVHALLARGRRELDSLFPGFRDAMVARGAVEADMGSEAAVMRSYGWAPRHPFGIDVLLASRRLVERIVREACVETSNVTVLERSTVTGLRTVRIADRLRATGIRLSSATASGTLDADLVVDASGGSSKAPEWLREIGLEAPAETIVDGLAGYSTRWYEAPDRLPEGWWWKSILIEPRPPECMYAAVLVPVEDRRWIVTLGGLSGRYPPTDPDEFTAALRWIRSPLVAEAVSLARPITPVFGSRAMANRRRHYERWRGRLDGFVAVADSACVFNPIYGQGMTTAAMCAQALGVAIRRTGPTHPDLARTFFRLQAHAQRDAWRLAAGADLRLPDTVGPRPLGANLFNRYVDAVFLASREDAVVNQRLFEVLQMLQPVSSLVSPSIGARVARSAVRSVLAGRPSFRGPVPATPPLRDTL